MEGDPVLCNLNAAERARAQASVPFHGQREGLDQGLHENAAHEEGLGLLEAEGSGRGVDGSEAGAKILDAVEETNPAAAV